MTIQTGDAVDWTYSGLTTQATVLTLEPDNLHARIQFVGTKGLVEVRVPVSELELTAGSGLRMYRVDADANTLQLLKSLLRDVGIRVVAQYPHHTIVATNEPNKLALLRDNLPSMFTRRLPGRYNG